jgi:hypothetical protein
MFNPIKGIRLIWHMRRVVGGYENGKAGEVVDAYIKAGIFSQNERDECIQLLNRDRAADHCRELARRLRRS